MVESQLRTSQPCDRSLLKQVLWRNCVLFATCCRDVDVAVRGTRGSWPLGSGTLHNATPPSCLTSTRGAYLNLEGLVLSSNKVSRARRHAYMPTMFCQDYTIVCSTFDCQILVVDSSFSMNVHSTFLYGLNRSTFPLPSKILSSNQDEYRSVSRSIDTCHGRDLRSTLAERRSCPHPAPLILPRKRSIRSLAPEYTQDVQTSRSSSSPPYRSVKRTKEAALPLLSLQSVDTIEDTVDGPSSPLESPRTPEDRTTGRAHSASIDSNREFTSAKPLRSPIRFIPGFHAHNTAITSTTPTKTPEHKSSSVSEKSRYRYYGPTNPSDQVERFSPGCGRVPRRQLSYGDPKPWSLHRATGSQELRLKAGLEADNYDSFYWSDNTAVGLNTVKPKEWYSEPTRPKPRLWLDLVDDGEPIEEAVSQHEHKESVEDATNLCTASDCSEN